MSTKEYTKQEKDNIAVVHRWLDLYNNDAERLVREIYAPDTVVKTMGGGDIQRHRSFPQDREGRAERGPPTIVPTEPHSLSTATPASWRSLC